MDRSTRASFVAKANAADKRNELKNEAAKCKQTSSDKGKARRTTSKKQSLVKDNFLMLDNRDFQP